MQCVNRGDYVKIQYNSDASDLLKSPNYEVGLVIQVNEKNLYVGFQKSMPLPTNSYLTMQRYTSENLYPYIYIVDNEQVFISDYKPGLPLYNIKRFFGKLSFCKVQSVELDRANPQSLQVYRYDGTSESSEIINIGTDLTQPYMNEMCHIKPGYVYYYGFAEYSANQRNDNIRPTHTGVYFQKTNYDHLDIISQNMGKWKTSSTSMNPPEINQIICGTLAHGQTTRFTHWFISSEEFHNLWILIMFGETHTIFQDKNKKQILDLLETSIHLKTVGPPHKKMENYKFKVCEPAAKKYVDVYTSIARVFYYNEDIPLSYYIPMIHQTYQRYLLYVFG